MKIALVRSSVLRTGGVGRYVWHLANELSRFGHDVHVITRKYDYFANNSIQVHKIHFHVPFSFLKVIFFNNRVKRILQRESYDIVHSFDRFVDCDLYRAGEGLHKEWLSVSRKYLPVWKNLLRLLNPLHFLLLSLEKRIFSISSTPIVTAISKRGREEIYRHYGLEKVPVIYNGVNPDEFSLPDDKVRSSLRNELGLPEDASLVLYVGGGFFRKGLSFLIDGFSKLPIETKKKTFLLVVGRGSLNSYMKKVRRYDIQNNVFFLGSLDDTSRFYKASDIFILPSLYEPFGNVCLEALSSGLLCIFSSRCGGAEIITNDKNGFILEDPTDPNEISKLLNHCLTLSDRESISKSARDLASEFSLELNMKETEKLYFEIYKNKKDKS
jgi:UDP-glucose:(heptosyl)LPS alpha-1,3-glucosyltransferase